MNERLWRFVPVYLKRGRLPNDLSVPSICDTLETLSHDPANSSYSDPLLFRTVSILALELESSTLPTHRQLKQHAQTVAARLSMVPRHRPVHEVMAQSTLHANEGTYSIPLCRDITDNGSFSPLGLGDRRLDTYQRPRR